MPAECPPSTPTPTSSAATSPCRPKPSPSRTTTSNSNEYESLLDQHNIQYACIAAPSFLGTYNDYTLAAIRDRPRFKTTVILDPATDPYILRLMDRDRAEGVRLSLAQPKNPPRLHQPRLGPLPPPPRRHRLARPPPHRRPAPPASPPRPPSRPGQPSHRPFRPPRPRPRRPIRRLPSPAPRLRHRPHLGKTLRRLPHRLRPRPAWPPASSKSPAPTA